jgi:hypothetical protein
MGDACRDQTRLPILAGVTICLTDAGAVMVEARIG